MTEITVDELSDAEARRLYDRLGLRFSRTARDNLSTDEAIVWQAVCSAMNTPKRPAGPFLKYHGRATFGQQAKALIDFMRGSAASPMQRGEELILMALIVRCIVAWLSRGDRPVMHATVLNSAEYVASAVDRAYPGYARARMVGYLVQAAA